MIQEVITRDGFQIEPNFIDTREKIRIINRLSELGLSKIEVTSFVSPKAIPQLKDANDVVNSITRNPDISYAALVANKKGAERALDCSIDEINLVMSVSETHNLANVKRTNEDSMNTFQEIMKSVSNTKTTINGTLATAFGCPFEGEISEERVLSFIDRYLELGMDSITLADTTGMAHPKQVKELGSEIVKRYPKLPITLHFHNTRGMGLANVLAGISAGIVRYDASLSGLGGCPFAPGATGNICTEDVVHMLDVMGYETGVDLDGLINLSKEIPNIVGHEVPGQIIKAGKINDLHSVKS